MNDKEFIEVYKTIEKYAARYKKRETPDWLELTQAGFDSIKKEMFKWCAIYNAKCAIKAKYYRWKDSNYYEPASLTINAIKINGILELEEKEIDSSNTMIVYGKSEITGQCKICGKNLYRKNQKTCSRKCRQKKKK